MTSRGKAPLLSAQELHRTILTVLQSHKMTPAPVERSSTLSGDLALDSVALMEIIATLEDELRISIPDEELMELRTVGDVLDHVQERMRRLNRLTEDTHEAP